jgi:predicted transcriptional regulator
MIAMTDLLEKAVAAVRELPASSQDDIARVMLMLASGDQAPVPLTAEEEASIAESLAQAARGEFATDEQVRAVWAKHGL